jgi:hypothetical protein
VDKKNYSFGQPQINSLGDIIFLSMPESPFKLGRIYCTNRPMSIMHTTTEYFEDVEKLKQVTKEDSSSRSPRFIPKSKKFVFLRREPFGPHLGWAQRIS